VRAALIVFPVLALFLFGAASNLVGCAGGAGCSADVGVRPSGEYAGSYTATYTPTAPAQSETLTLAFTVSDFGQVTGTATGTSGDATLSGQAGPIKSGCDLKGAGIDLNLAYGARTDFLRSNKASRTKLAGTFEGERYSPDGAIGTGTLVVTKD